MKLFAIFLILGLLDAVSGSRSEDLSQSCIIRFLQIKGKLEDTFPSTSAPGELCRVLLPLIYANHSEKLVLKLWETKSIKAQCVFDALKNSQFIDGELQLEIFLQSTHMAVNVRRKREYEVMINQRKLLLDTAKNCRSDKTYGGIFDEILGINSSVILLHENYCFHKYAIENRFLEIPKIHLDSANYKTMNIDCQPIVEGKKKENERKLIAAFRKNKYSRLAIDCLLEKYKHERIFGWNLAKDLLKKIDLVAAVRVAEDMRISQKLAEFNKISTNCLFSLNWELFNFNLLSSY